MVFGCRPDHRRTADIDLFNDSLVIGCAGNRFLERIQIYDHQVDLRDMITYHFFQIRWMIPSPQDSAKDGRMQGFNPAAQDGRVGGKVLHRYTGKALQTR